MRQPGHIFAIGGIDHDVKGGLLEFLDSVKVATLMEAQQYPPHPLPAAARHEPLGNIQRRAGQVRGTIGAGGIGRVGISVFQPALLT